MSTIGVFPQTLYVEVEPKGSVGVESMERVAELYRAQKIIAPTHAAVNSQKLFEFLNGNLGRRSWIEATLSNTLGEGFAPRCVGFWKGRMYDDDDRFFEFATSIPPADVTLVPENFALPSKGTTVHFTVFEFNRKDKES